MRLYYGRDFVEILVDSTADVLTAAEALIAAQTPFLDVKALPLGCKIGARVLHGGVQQVGKRLRLGPGLGVGALSAAEIGPASYSPSPIERHSAFADEHDYEGRSNNAAWGEAAGRARSHLRGGGGGGHSSKQKSGRHDQWEEKEGATANAASDAGTCQLLVSAAYQRPSRLVTHRSVLEAVLVRYDEATRGFDVFLREDIEHIGGSGGGAGAGAAAALLSSGTFNNNNTSSVSANGNIADQYSSGSGLTTCRSPDLLFSTLASLRDAPAAPSSLSAGNGEHFSKNSIFGNYFNPSKRPATAAAAGGVYGNRDPVGNQTLREKEAEAHRRREMFAHATGGVSASSDVARRQAALEEIRLMRLGSNCGEGAAGRTPPQVGANFFGGGRRVVGPNDGEGSGARRLFASAPSPSAFGGAAGGHGEESDHHHDDSDDENYNSNGNKRRQTNVGDEARGRRKTGNERNIGGGGGRDFHASDVYAPPSRLRPLTALEALHAERRKRSAAVPSSPSAADEVAASGGAGPSSNRYYFASPQSSVADDKGDDAISSRNNLAGRNRCRAASAQTFRNHHATSSAEGGAPTFTSDFIEDDVERQRLIDRNYALRRHLTQKGGLLVGAAQVFTQQVPPATCCTSTTPPATPARAAAAAAGNSGYLSAISAAAAAANSRRPPLSPIAVASNGMVAMGVDGDPINNGVSSPSATNTTATYMQRSNATAGHAASPAASDIGARGLVSVLCEFNPPTVTVVGTVPPSAIAALEEAIFSRCVAETAQAAYYAEAYGFGRNSSGVGSGVSRYEQYLLKAEAKASAASASASTSMVDLDGGGLNQSSLLSRSQSRRQQTAAGTPVRALRASSPTFGGGYYTPSASSSSLSPSSPVGGLGSTTGPQQQNYDSSSHQRRPFSPSRQSYAANSPNRPRFVDIVASSLPLLRVQRLSLPHHYFSEAQQGMLYVAIMDAMEAAAKTANEEEAARYRQQQQQQRERNNSGVTDSTGNGFVGDGRASSGADLSSPLSYPRRLHHPDSPSSRRRASAREGGAATATLRQQQQPPFYYKMVPLDGQTALLQDVVKQLAAHHARAAKGPQGRFADEALTTTDPFKHSCEMVFIPTPL